MAFRPLTCSAACPGLSLGRCWRATAGPGRCDDRVLGGSGRGSGRAAGGFEQGHPFGLAVPAFGQVHGDVAAAVAGDAGGDGDQLAADGRAAGFRAEGVGQAAGGAGQVMADGGQGQPRGVGRELPRYGRWASGPSVQSAKTCSTMAWPRCWPSAWISSNGESVNTAW